MEFTTHNNEAIETTGLSAQGVVDAKKDELVSLFGKPIGNNFVVKFKDGSRALLYPSSADHWYVEGTAKQSITNVQITLDLFREQAAEKTSDPIEKALSPAFDMMASIKANKGEDYATLLELALLARKSMDLVNVLVSGHVIEGHMAEEVGVAMTKTSAHITAKIIGLGARLSKVDTDKNTANELMDWAEKLMKLESDGVKGLMKEVKDTDD
jgi:hypothetical protein